jgi:hypothetical protein
MAMADALLQRETLDAEQVMKLAAGLPLDEPAPITPPGGHEVPPTREPNWKERNPLVPTLPPRPVTQE